MDGQVSVVARVRDELLFSVGGSNLDDPVLLSAEFAPTPEKPDVIVKRLRKAWIQRKASHLLQLPGRGSGLQESAGQVGCGT